MNTYRLKNLYEKLFGVRFLLVAIIYTVYCFINLHYLSSFNVDRHSYIIYMLTDHYYIVFFQAILFLSLMSSFFTDKNAYEIFRKKRYYNHYTEQFIEVLVITIFFTGLHLSITYLMSLAIPASKIFELDTTGIWDAVLYIYRTLPKQWSSLIISGYSFMGYLFIGVLVLLVSNVFNRKFAVYSAFALYASIIIGHISVTRNLLSSLSLKASIVLTYTSSAFNPFIYLAFEILGIVIISIYFRLYGAYENKTIDFSSLIKPHTLINLRNLLLSAGFLTMHAYFTYKQQSYSSLGMFLDGINIGYGIGYVDIFRFLSFIVYNSVPIYFILAYISSQESQRNSCHVIRMRFRLLWLKEIVISSMKFISLYILIGIVISSTVYFFTLNLDSYSIQTILSFRSLTDVLFHHFYGRFLELVFYLLIVIVANALTRSTFVSFIVYLFGYLPLLLGKMSAITSYPWGIASVLRTTAHEEIHCISKTSASLSILIPIIILAGISVYIYKYKFDFESEGY